MDIHRLMIITGGTGGHIFPGLVISKYFKKKGCLIKWIGSSNRLEYILVPKYGFDINFIDIPKISKWNFIFNIFKFIKSIYCIIKIIKKWNPDLVIGFGGYISFFGIFSAWLCGIKTMIHEQNAVLGWSNRYLYYISDIVVQAFPNSFNSNIPVVGNPIRKEILLIPQPKIRLLKRKGYINVLVLGGSQGSCIINNVMFDLLKILSGKKFFFLHQVGYTNYKNFINDKRYTKYSNYRVVDFINKIEKAYYWCDLIISRSGALTVSEISSVGIASIFIPYVHKDKQQYLNAEFLERKGAAIIIDEYNLNANYLSKVILSLDRSKLFFMSNIAYINRVKSPNEKFVNEIYNFKF